VAIFCLLGAIALAVYSAGRRGPEVQSAPPLAGRYALAATHAYDPVNLYELIDGQAPYYVDYGFRSLLVLDYGAPDSGRGITVQRYNMGSRRNAYGIFFDSRAPEDPLIPLGNAGTLQGNNAAFWKDVYYVRISATVDQDISADIRKAAEEVAASIQDPAGRDIPEFAAFPTEDLVKDSFSYYRTAAFGIGHLTDTYAAAYKSRDAAWKTFFRPCADAKEAAEILQKHLKFLESSRTAEKSFDDAESWVWGTHKYAGPSFVIAQGKLIAGCIGLSDRASAEAAARALLRRAQAAPATLAARGDR